MENICKYAELFKIICDNFNGSEHLGKKVCQKLFYFFEREGLHLNLRYGIHYYGPYSSKLDDTMHILEGEEYINIDTSNTTHVISVGKTSVNDESLTEDDIKIANDVLSKFGTKSPMELEALATMDYVANNILTSNASDEEIICKFKEIKSNKFNEIIIQNTLSELKSFGFICA